MPIKKLKRKWGENADAALPALSGPSATHSHLAKAHAEGLLPETDSMPGNGTGATLKHRTVPEHRQRPTNVSLEEQKILLSLDRLNQRLLCKQVNQGDCIRTKLTD